MKSKDVIKQELNTNLSVAMQSKDPAALTDAFADFAVKLQADVVEDAKAYQQTQDSAILARRGVRQLTEEEKKFYSDVMGGLKAHFDNPKMAFTGLDSTTLPTTVIDNVLSDIFSNSECNQFPEYFSNYKVCRQQTRNATCNLGRTEHQNCDGAQRCYWHSGNHAEQTHSFHGRIP
mgnify:CR=1 FL=1